MSAIHVESFNRNIRILSRELTKKYPSDAIIARAHKRVNTIVQAAPCAAIELAGPYLLKYRDQIYSPGAEAFFLEKSFDDDLSNLSRDENTLVAYIIPKTKECARTLPKEEKEQYKQLVIELLDSYIFYIDERKRE